MKVAYQLYCSRNFPPLGDICAMLAQTGYAYVEGYDGLFGDLNALEAALNDNNLAMPSCHMGLDLVRDNPQQAIGIAKRFGIEKVYVPFLDPASRPADDAGWRSFGETLAEAGKPLRDAGIKFGWHNHDFEFVPTSTGAQPLDIIAESDLSLEIDLGWVLVAKEDAVAWIEKYAPRISAVHIKDIAPEGEALDEDGWSDVGHGTVDWAPIHAALQNAGVDHYVIEHDNPKDHVQFAQRSFASVSKF